MRFLKWLGTRTYLTNGQVMGWFDMGILVGMVIGALIGISIGDTK